MGKLATTWELAKVSWSVLRADKELLLLPVLSAICAILVSVTFFVPLILAPEMAAKGQQGFGVYLGLFLFYFVNYFVGDFLQHSVDRGRHHPTAGRRSNGPRWTEHRLAKPGADRSVGGGGRHHRHGPAHR